ncbi:G2/M phase-specific E3 ubiquitin-protein ligase, partial [Megadyptes antipodes antipodes]
QRCFVCGESGAAITCRETGCDRSFHLPCAVEGGCITQFLPQYRSFCWEHRPEQAVEAAPEENTTCLICLDPVEDRKSYSTMVCPACKHAWFHRGCIQVGAVPSSPGHSRHSAAPGPHPCSLCCSCRDRLSALAFLVSSAPLCRDKDLFLMEMLTMGIRIPFR